MSAGSQPSAHNTNGKPSRARAWRGWIGALLCLACVLAVYLLTLAPTVQGFDSAELTVGAYTLGFVHPPGYPLYMLVGHLFAQIPLGDVGFRLNVMSATFGTLTALTLYALIWLQTGDWLTSVVPTLMFSTIPIFWSQAIRAEVYTLHSFLMASALLAWFHARSSGRIAPLVLSFALLGLGMANHLTTALLWTCVLICTVWSSARWRRASLGTVLLGLAIAGLLYTYFFVRTRSELAVDYIRPYFGVDPGTLDGLWWMLSARAFRPLFYLDLSPANLWQDIVDLSTQIWNNSLGVGLFLGIWGWRRLHKTLRLWNCLLSLYFVANLVLFLTYHVADREVMSVVMYVVGSIWIAQGIRGFASWAALRLRSLTPSQCSVAVNLILLLVIVIGAYLNWSSVTLSHNQRTYDFAAQLLERVAPSTMIVNHWVTAAVLDYLQIVEGRRPDVSSFNLEFYFLGLQTQYRSLDSVPAQLAWFSWLDDQLERRPLCFVEPLPPVPSHLRWAGGDVCWTLAAAEGAGQ
jgi:hypothetical protein